MPSHRQILTTPVPRQNGASVGLGTYGLGSADYAALRAIYPAAPGYDGSYGDEQVIATWERLNQNPISDGGHTFGTVDRDYGGAPNLQDVQTGGGGLPLTPYSPNPATPGPGMNPRNIPAVDPSLARRGGGGFGVGDGLASPSETSRVIARQKIGNLIFGSSTPRS